MLPPGIPAIGVVGGDDGGEAGGEAWDEGGDVGGEVGSLADAATAPLHARSPTRPRAASEPMMASPIMTEAYWRDWSAWVAHTDALVVGALLSCVVTLLRFMVALLAGMASGGDGVGQVVAAGQSHGSGSGHEAAAGASF